MEQVGKKDAKKERPLAEPLPIGVDENSLNYDSESYDNRNNLPTDGNGIYIIDPIRILGAVSSTFPASGKVLYRFPSE